jgi:RNA polymerase sigma-70 factor (ECF subfamily)
MNVTDQKAQFRTWVNDHRALIYKVVKIYARPSDADDLLQDILMQLWQSIPAFKQQSKPSTWIYRVALNTALTKHRKDKKHKQKRQSIDMDSITADRQAKPDTDEANAIDQLYHAIRQLPKIDSSLILMHLDGLSHGDIAEVLGITENHVGVRLHRAKQRIGELMRGVINDL